MSAKHTGVGIGMAVAMAALLCAAEPALAGCGCTKPAPPPAAVRPAVAWPGAIVTVFHPAMVEGHRYIVRFTAAESGMVAYGRDTAALRRDLADGVVKPRIAVALPALPLGPAAIGLYDAAMRPLAELDDDAFTVAPMPIGVPNGVGEFRFENYRAAVSRDGIVHVALDFADVQHARVFDARADGLPLRFGADDVSFWNVQGFLMQLLGAKMPGLFSIGASSGASSDVLRYSRHEFNTWFLQHGEREDHSIDPSDPNWHLDGTPHIDHDRQILAIAATLPGGAPLEPGATPPFTLVVTAETLFSRGAVGRDAVIVDNGAQVRSFDRARQTLGDRGHVYSDGPVEVKSGATVHGDATGSSFLIDGGLVTGSLLAPADVLDPLGVSAPPGLVELGDVTIAGGTSTLPVGSYAASKIEVKNGGRLRIENASGPVTIYVRGDVVVDSGGRIETADADPENFAIYLVGDGLAKFTDDTGFHGVVYGPDASILIDDRGAFVGAFVGASLVVQNEATVLFDEALHGDACAAQPPLLVAPAELAVQPGREIRLPIDLDDLPAGTSLRIGDRSVPLVADGAEAVATAPASLHGGTLVEIALVDANGCRSRRTVLASVERAPVCGLLGIELALIVPLMRRRRRGG